jgi:ethanolamine ammonia-lyase small subunit
VRAATPSRVGLGRRGDSLPTSALLDLREAHAVARDAIHLPLDVERLRAEAMACPELAGLGEPLLVRSRAIDRSAYLRRPDLGRRLDLACRIGEVFPGSASSGSASSGTESRGSGSSAADSSGSESSGSEFSDGDAGAGASLPGLAIVIADGLSTAAVAAHGVPMAQALVAELSADFRLAPLTIAGQARVAIGDEIGAALGVDEVIVLIGERPGLSVSDSLGGYLTHSPQVGRRDSERNCVSNIRPGGLSYRVAAATLARLARGAMELGRSGVTLKDTGGQIETMSRAELPPA